MRKNRYRAAKRTHKKSSLKRIIFTGLFFCFLAGSVYFLIFWPGLWVDKIGINASALPIKEEISSGIIEIVQRNLEEKFWQFIPQKSIVLAPLSKIEENILDKFPKIKIVQINRRMPRLSAIKSLAQKAEAGLEIFFEERESIGIWCQIEEIAKEEQLNEEQLIEETRKTEKEEIIAQPKIKKCFYIDQEGIVFKESPLISGSLVLNIYSSRDKEVNLRQQVLSPETIDFILTVREKLPKIKTTAGLSWQMNNFRVVSLGDLRLTMAAGWQIYFNPTYSAESQLRSLEMVLEKQIKETTSLEYIDLKIDGRVYYK